MAALTLRSALTRGLTNDEVDANLVALNNELATKVNQAGARSAISVSGSLSYNATTGVISYTTPVTSVAGKTGAVTLTKSDVGLSVVENKTSSTIRSEITSGNVTGALGFTPPASDGTGASGTWGISISGNAASASTTDNINGLPFYNRYSSNALAQDSYQYNGLGYVTGVSQFGQTDGAMYAASYSTSWVHQIYGDFRTGQVSIRGKNSGTWQAWRIVLDSGNYTSYVGNGAMTVTAGSGLTGGGQVGTANQSGASSITISHADTSSQASVNNSGATVIQDVTLDGYGHVTGLASKTIGYADVGAPSTTGTNASGTWGISISGNAATASALQTTRSINGVSFNGSADIKVTDWFHSGRDFVSGTLVTTDINYAVTSGDPFVLEIRGNSYGDAVPYDIQYQGYIYSNTIINHGGYSNGTNISGLVALNVGGNLCFWWPRQSYWNGFNVRVYSAYQTYAINRITSITSTAKPAGTKEVGLSANIRQSLHSSNYNSYAPTLTGGGASGTWGINITGSANTLDGIDSSGFVQTTNNSSLNGDTRNTRGVTRLYRRDDNSDYSVQHYWTGSHWYLQGFNGDTFHAHCRVGYADSAGSAPASDVYAWAKASAKPSYTYSEVGAAAASHSHSYLPLSGGSISGDGYITFGPNSSWGSSLRVGGNGRTATGTEMASVVTTDGNLHLDAAASANAIYLNYYAGTEGVKFGNGASGIVGGIDSAGNASFNGNVTAYSDEQLKTDWDTLPSDYVEQLAGVLSGTYTRIDTGVRQIGVGAQSLKAVAPDGVVDGEYLSVAYGNVALASAVELAKRVVKLGAQIAHLTSIVEKLTKA
jgi:hypothetical protein